MSVMKCYAILIITRVCCAGAAKDVAKKMLDVCNGNLEMAINMQVEAAERLQSGDTEASPMSTAEPTIYDGSVRAPIPPTRGILVEEGAGYGFRVRRRPAKSVFDSFRDFQAETKRQEQELLEAGRSALSPKHKTLEDLFRPPIDVMHKGTFDTAREVGQSLNKWLMVNVQNVQEFVCQTLNRDIWSNQTVKNMIKEHFVFWQVYHDSDEGQRYMQFYKVLDWPYVAIIDPRTGENLVVWNKVDPLSFCDLVTEFLARHPPIDGSFTPPRKKSKMELEEPPIPIPPIIESILDASEDTQMEAAIKASLVDTSGGQSSSQTVCKPPCEIEDSSEIETFESDAENSNMTSNSTGSKTDVRTEDDTASVPSNCSGIPAKKQECSSSKENWEMHLGEQSGPKSNLVIRFPDGTKEQLSLPSSSKLLALILFVESRGYGGQQFELVTNFPRRQLSTMDGHMSLSDAGLFPQETVFVHGR